MGLMQHGLGRTFVVAATTAMMAVMLAVTFGAGLAHATQAEKYYVDTNFNVCVGNEFTSPFCNWEGKVTGF